MYLVNGATNSVTYREPYNRYKIRFTMSSKNFQQNAEPLTIVKSFENAADYGEVIEEQEKANGFVRDKPAVNHRPFLGLLYTFLCCITFGLTSVVVKKLSYISPGQLTFVRNAGVFCGSLPIAVFCVKNIMGEKKDRKLLIVRGFLGTTNLYFNIMAYSYLPLADVAIVLSISPIVTILIARVWLKEPFDRAQSLSLLLTLCGVLSSVRLPELLKKRSAFTFDYTYIIGLSAAFACVITLSFTLVALRKMKHIHFSVIMLYFGVLGMFENVVINGVASIYDTVRCGGDHVLYVLIGVTALAANCFLTFALKVEEAAIVSVLRSSLEIIVALVFQVLFFVAKPDMYNILGAILVMSSVSILGIRNWLLRLPVESKARKRLKNFL